VRDNAALGLRIRRFYGRDGTHTPVDEDLGAVQERVDQWLRRLAIDHVADQYPNQISGGQRQRTAIARTLVLRPDLLLMDEPFGALDALTREDLQLLTLELMVEKGLTTVIVTHNIEEAVILGRRILVLGQPPNKSALTVENDDSGWGTPEYRSRPTFLSRCNELRELLEESDGALA
jgi:NitT/TauT family transport system ATP-binding protein